MTTGDFVFLAPGLFAGIIGAALFVMTIRHHLFVSVFGLLGALAELSFYFMFTSTSSTNSELPHWIETLFNSFCFFGGSFFLLCATLLIARSKNLRWKRCLFFTLLFGFLVAVAHLAIVIKVLSEIP